MPDIASLLMAQQPNARIDPLARQKRYAQLLMQQGSSVEPVKSPLEGLARALQGGVGGFFAGQADRQEKSDRQADIQGMADLLSANTPKAMAKAASTLKNADLAAPLLAQAIAERQKVLRSGQDADAFTAYNKPQPPGTQAPGPQVASASLPAPAQGSADPAANAIAGIEVKGQPNNGYGAIGPTTNGSKPYGRYQVMDFNIAPWTKQVLGQEMTPDQFLANPQAQEAVFKAKFGEYQQKYGDRAASAWFAGENGMNNPNAKDANGTTVAQYQQKYQAGMPAQGSDLPAQPGQPRADGSGNATPPQQSNVPDVPRPAYTPEQLQKAEAAIRSGVPRAQVQADLDKENLAEWQYQRENRRMQWQQDQENQRAKTKAETDLNQKAPMELIAKRMDNYENKVRPAAMAAVNEIPVIHQARQILDAGAFTGTGAGAKTMLSKIGEQLGIPSEEAQNTQVLGSVLAKRTLAASGGTLGTGFSNADRDFMEMASGGKVSLDEGAIRRILDIGERQARQTMTQHDTETKRLSKVPGVAQLGEDYLRLPEAPTYADWAKANPLPQATGGATQPQAAAPAANAVPADGATATNPKTGQKVILRGGQWVPQ